jgi:hypothetical protein
LFLSLFPKVNFYHNPKNKKPETFVSGFLCGERGIISSSQKGRPTNKTQLKINFDFVFCFEAYSQK